MDGEKDFRVKMGVLRLFSVLRNKFPEGFTLNQ